MEKNMITLKGINGGVLGVIKKYGHNIEVLYTPGQKARVYYKGALVSLAWFNKNVACISKGNIKLKPTASHKFAIFNVISQGIALEDFNRIAESIREKCDGFDYDAALDNARSLFKNGRFWGCPGATAECIKFCYDAAAQNGYRKKTILPSRVRNFIFSCSPEFIDLMYLYFVLRFETDAELADPGVMLDFRIHEGGEMYSQKYADDLIKLCFMVKALYKDRVYPYTYTKSFFYLKKYLNASGRGHVFDHFLTVNGSLWNDSSDAARSYVMDHDMSFYTVWEKDQLDAYIAAGREDVHICECQECGDCGKCREQGKKIVLKHGHEIQ